MIAFAAYKHDCWVLDRQNEGWSHGVKYDEERRKHPNIKPFNMLSQEVIDMHCLTKLNKPAGVGPS